MVKKTDFNTKVTEIEDKIPSINGLATNSELIAVEIKIPDVSSLVKRTDYATEITSIKNDYVTNAALNAGLKDLIQKTKFDNEVKKINDKIASNSSATLLYNNRQKQVKDRIDDLERYASYFRGKNYFDEDDGTQSA